MVNRVMRVSNAKTYSKQSVLQTHVNVQAVSPLLKDTVLGLLVCTKYTLAT